MTVSPRWQSWLRSALASGMRLPYWVPSIRPGSASSLASAAVASSSWSHAFLVDRTWRLQPDVAADWALYEAMVAGDYRRWRDTPLAAVEDAGQQEVLNWFALVGAMHALGARVQWSEFVETWVFNSSKVAAVFEPR